MRLVHSQLANEAGEPIEATPMAPVEGSSWGERYSWMFFQKALKKPEIADQIAKIQEHIPGWMPEFRFNKY